MADQHNIYNPRKIDMDKYFVGTDEEDAVERFDAHEWEEDAERRADSLWAQGGETFKVFKIRTTVNLSMCQVTYVAEDD